jgi:dephospho-CoA kinase
MRRILLTGISGVGKSTVTDELAQRGYKAVDADDDAFSVWVEVAGELVEAAGTPVEADRDWVWREDRIGELLVTEDTETLFMGGCAANMGKFLPQFDSVILLTAPADVIVTRLQTRKNNVYGRHPDELARVLSLKDSVEPILRRVAGHKIDTSAPLDDVVASVLRLAG